MAAPMVTTTLCARVGAPVKASRATTVTRNLALTLCRGAFWLLGMQHPSWGAGDREGTPALSQVTPPAPCLFVPPAPPGQHPLQQRPPLPPLGRGGCGSCQTLLPPGGLLLPQVSGSPVWLCSSTGTPRCWVHQPIPGRRDAHPWGMWQAGVPCLPPGHCHPTRGRSVAQDGQRFIRSHPTHLGPLWLHRRSPETLALCLGRV